MAPTGYGKRINPIDRKRKANQPTIISSTTFISSPSTTGGKQVVEVPTYLDLPTIGTPETIYITLDDNYSYRYSITEGYIGFAVGVDINWGDIQGDILDQLDLQSALDDKADTSSLGDLATLDQVDTAQITNHAVTNTELAQMNANTVKGRLAGNGTPQDIAMADLPISNAVQTALDDKADTSSLGDLATLDTVDTAQIDDDAVTLDKIQNIATKRVLARSTAGVGSVEDLTLPDFRSLINVEDGAQVNTVTPTNTVALTNKDLTTGNTFPTFNQNTTGTASNVTGTVAVANGGTGATTASGARTALDVPGLNTINTFTASQAISNAISSIVSNGAGSLGYYATLYEDSTTSMQNVFMRARGSVATPTAILLNDGIGSLSFRGHTGSVFTGSKGLISVTATENRSPTANGTRIDFSTTPNGSTTVGSAMRIDQDKSVIIYGSNLTVGGKTPAYLGTANTFTGTQKVIGRIDLTGDQSAVLHEKTDGTDMFLVGLRSDFSPTDFTFYSYGGDWNFNNGNIKRSGQNRTSGWSTFTVVFNQTVTHNCIGYYKQIGKQVFFEVHGQITNKLSASGVASIALPVNSVTTHSEMPINGFCLATGQNPATQNKGQAVVFGGSTYFITGWGSTALNYSSITNNDWRVMSGVYEAS